jgi:dolichyl-phosphate-mannose-protein mannosyltransferase
MVKKAYYPIIFSVILAFFVKWILAFLPGFGADIGAWFGWASRLADLGPGKFYTDEVWTQYTPGYLYVLWLIGEAGIISEMAVKIPVIFADLFVGVLIWKIVKKVNPKWALPAFFLYTLNPVVIFDGSIWGQIDGFLTLFLFLSAYYLIEKRNLIMSTVLWSVAFLVKPQSIAVLPALLLPVLTRKFNLKEIALAGVAGLLTLFIGSYPFFRDNPILGLPMWMIKMGDYYAYTSVFAFNIWSWVGFWKPDNVLFLGLKLATWGTLLLLGSALGAMYIFRDKIKEKHNFYILFAILSIGFFTFPTRVHERYLFPLFAFLLTGALTSKSRNLLYIYGVTSFASFLNLYYPYVYYYPAQLNFKPLFVLSESLAKMVGLVFLLSYFALLFWEKLPKLPDIKMGGFKKENKLPEIKISKKTKNLILPAILVFSFLARVLWLGQPPKEYFDEVYHAFTAKVILNGGVEAWEWWNNPPEGFAYEWTHPPLAKLGMWGGMKIFGENSFGYRIPQALLGVGSVYLVYLIAKKLFKDELLALFSAGALSLDGLLLVMNRIGMNDSYLLFFSLLSIYLFMKEKDVGSALAFGLALASKWSAVWAIPILGILWLKRKKKFRISTFTFFVLLPPLVYLASYLPMFLTGHSLEVWWEMQKQMWWYHTGLDATHPYTSPWWSWPFLVRPIYLYTSDEIGGFVSRIYAFGNPIFFWFGAASVVLGFLYAFIEKNKNLGFVIFSYLIFFVPWAASPRIMFLYHYLPSLPFMAIAIGYILRKNPQLVKIFFITSLILFIYFYPHWAGIRIPLWLDTSYYWVDTWR